MAKGTELAKAYVQIVPSADGIKGAITNVLGGEAASAGSQAGESIASKIKNVIISAGIGTALTKAVMEGANLEQSIGGIETLFKESADVMKEYASEAYKTAGVSANDYMEQVTSFSASLLSSLDGDTAKAAEAANQAIIDMADNSNKMGTAIENIQNAYQGFAKQNYTMLDNLKLGYGGTKKEMERLLADAQKISGVKYDIENLNDVYSAIHVIQNELGITGTTAKEASETVAGSMAAMKAAAQNVMGNLALGQNVNQSLFELRGATSTFLYDNFLPMFGNVVSSIPDVVGQGMSFLVSGLNRAMHNTDSIINSGVELVQNLALAILSKTPYIVESGIGLITSLASTIMEMDWKGIANEFMESLNDALWQAGGEILGVDENIIDHLLRTITDKLPELFAKGTEIATNVINGVLSKASDFQVISGNILNGFIGIMADMMPDILKQGVAILTSIVNGIVSRIPTLIDTAGNVVNNFIYEIADMLPEIVEAGIDLILNLVDGIIDGLPEIVSSAIDVIFLLAKTLLEKAPMLLESGFILVGKLTAGLIKAVPDLISTIPGIIDKIIKKFEEIEWKQIGKDILNGIAKGIAGGVGTIVDAAKDAAKSALNAAKKFLGIKSPSRVFRDQIGKMIDLGLAGGIEGNLKPVSEAMKELKDVTVGEITPKTYKPDIALSTAIPTEIQRNGENDGLIQEVISLMKQQIVLLLKISEKEMGISDDDIFNSVRKSAQDYKNRTGNPSFT